ncbi:hypothetical protein Rhe02_17030 [Rhizocola hellebori]|uniref:Uncharacterized protein n=1 Tax=Rhizocola hellebori TaxID=1392758 RepID=A0A8J3Q5C3_9ACTN|nr:hypothetical protein [Rhizocola hellebori]GIH03636.1 hypothetical protein Rhe02_17030 [Rhizocola hellebori]
MEDNIISMPDRPVIACDMSTAPDTPDERTAEYGRLFGQHLLGKERTAEGIRFRLRAAEGVEAWVRDLSAREKACCPFADFEIATADEEVRWDITVVDDDLARAALDEFYQVPEMTSAGEDWRVMGQRLADRGFSITTR